MLQKLNERIQGIIAWVILGLIMVTFALFGLDYYMQAHIASAVIVNGETISQQELAMRERRARQLLRSAEKPQETAAQLKQRVLNELIQKQVLVQAAVKRGFYVSLGEAIQTILNIPQFQADGHFASDRYAEALNGALFTEAAFHEEVRQGMLLNQQRFAFIGTAFVLPNETATFAKFNLEKRDYAYVVISKQQFISKVSVTPAEILQYYKNNQSRFLTPEQVSIEYVKLSMQDAQSHIKITDAALRGYYAENMLKQPFDEVKATIQAQLVLEEAEAQYNKSLEKLSDLSYQTPDTLSPVALALHLPLEHTALFTSTGGNDALTKNPNILRAVFSDEVLKFGNNSAPINLNDNTVVVLRVRQRVPAKVQDLSAVSAVIKAELEQGKAAIAATHFGQQLILELKQQGGIKSQQLHWQTVKDARNEADSPVEIINNLAFKVTLSTPIQGIALPNGDYAIVHLLKIIPGDELSLDPESRGAMRQQLSFNDGLIEYDLYLSTLLHQAKVKVTS